MLNFFLKQRDLGISQIEELRWGQGASMGSGLVSDAQPQFGFNRLFSFHHRSLLQLDFCSSRQVGNATSAAQTEKRTQFW